MAYKIEDTSSDNISFSSDFEHGSDDEISNDQKPRILLIGFRKSGKSSIEKRLFRKLSPVETDRDYQLDRAYQSDRAYQLDTNDQLMKSFVQFKTLGIYRQLKFLGPEFDSNATFGDCDALVFVIDAHGDYVNALLKLKLIVIMARKANPNIQFDILIHKVDGMTDDYKNETFHIIRKRANIDFSQEGMEHHQFGLHLTSVYDLSIFEVFSKIVQKVIPQHPSLKNILNTFISTSGVEKALILDVASKLYIAADSTFVDQKTYEFCCETIDTALNVSKLLSLPSETHEYSFDSFSSCVLKLENDVVLYLLAVNRYFVLASIVEKETFENQGFLDHNFKWVCYAIHDVFRVEIEDTFL